MDLTSDFPQVKYFQTPVDIEIVTPKGSRIEMVFIQPKEENIFTFKNVESKPLIIDFDNEGTLIKEITFKKSMDELLYQAKTTAIFSAEIGRCRNYRILPKQKTHPQPIK